MPTRLPDSTTVTPPTFAQLFNAERPAVLSRLGGAETTLPTVPKKLVDPVAAKLAPRSMAGIATTVGSRPPIPVSAEQSTIAAAGAADGASPVDEAPVSEAMMTHSRAPAVLQAVTAILKWGMLGVAGVVACYAATRYVLLPVMKEMKPPAPGTEIVVDKNAPTAAKVLQQTRQVVAKNDAKVDYLHTILGEPPKKTAASAGETKAIAPAVAAAPPTLLPRATSYREAVERFEVSGASFVEEPRILLDGRLVKYGEIVDRQLGLRFMGLDAEDQSALFTNAANEVFRKRY